MSAGSCTGRLMRQKVDIGVCWLFLLVRALLLPLMCTFLSATASIASLGIALDLVGDPEASCP